jgi:hypothetical protein
MYLQKEEEITHINSRNLLHSTAPTTSLSLLVRPPSTAACRPKSPCRRPRRGAPRPPPDSAPPGPTACTSTSIVYPSTNQPPPDRRTQQFRTANGLSYRCLRRRRRPAIGQSEGKATPRGGPIGPGRRGQAGIGHWGCRKRKGGRRSAARSLAARRGPGARCASAALPEASGQLSSSIPSRSPGRAESHGSMPGNGD